MDGEHQGPPPLQHPGPADLSAFVRLIDEAAGAIAALGQGKTDGIYSQAVSDLAAVREQAGDALRQWPALGLTRGLDEKGYGADFDPERRRVHDLIDPVQAFHRDWRARYERPAVIRRPT